MLLQSLLGVQLDQFKKGFKPNPVPLKNFRNPGEFQCLGFNLTNLDVLINQGFIQIDAHYINIDEPNKFICDGFESMLRQTPDKIFDMLGGYVPGMKKKLTE